MEENLVENGKIKGMKKGKQRKKKQESLKVNKKVENQEI